MEEKSSKIMLLFFPALRFSLCCSSREDGTGILMKMHSGVCFYALIVEKESVHKNSLIMVTFYMQ